LMERTRLGAMIRAGVDDPEMAGAVGIPVSRLFTTVFCLGAALAGAGGVIGGPIMSAYPGLDADMLPLALIVVILGGVGSLLGAFAGAFITGFVYTFGVALLPDLAYVILFLPLIAVLATTLMGCAFGLIALRATGLGFLMLTLALSQVLWGTAYRWVSMTDGDNGLRGLARPMPFGLDLNQAMPFYYFALVIGAFSIWMMARFVGSAFGATLKGARDEPRRMSALGYDVWLIRWITFVYASFWGAVLGL